MVEEKQRKQDCKRHEASILKEFPYIESMEYERVYEAAQLILEEMSSPADG